MTKRLRIGIDGAQGVGKTSLFDALARRFGDLFTFVPEASRSIAGRFGVNTSSDWPSLIGDRDRLEAFFDAEREWVESGEDAAVSSITDSSLWIVAAYRKHFGCRSGVEAAVARDYDLLLCCAPSQAVSVDGFRFVDGRDEVDRIYRSLIGSAFRGVYVWLPSGAGRLASAIEAVERFRDDPQLRETRAHVDG